MKGNERFHEAAKAAGGTIGVPFYGVVAPTIYVGEIAATAFSGVTGAMQRAVEGVRQWHWERKTRAALSRLDDAILQDIGVTRSKIPAVARTAAESATFDSARRFPWAA